MLRPTVASVVAAAIAAAVATALVVFVPVLHFAYRQHELHVGLETAAALIGLLGSYLLFGRFRRRRRLDDLVLFIALALFALTNLLFAAIPAMVTDFGSSTVFHLGGALRSSARSVRLCRSGLRPFQTLGLLWAQEVAGDLDSGGARGRDRTSDR